ncbi:hypothetical protein PYCCODRAFT_1443125 [Trametes coccinea BRFM310]|uniref:Uncharacterized protein n=1 Tax=Trametes coccinea (strain BRFM310) TaxID=1353009 RepID=A0A1Y2IX45_TRAC3|nr:hypothetical protein PYCCODRAFT_1443125 [Trametes coccinea BRFM310]
MALLVGVLTLVVQHSKDLTCPDNMFCSELLTEVLVCCEVMLHLRLPKMNHYPILITLCTDVVLSLALAVHPLPMALVTSQDFNRVLQRLNEALQVAIEADVPTSSPTTPFSKQWWSKDLHSKQKAVKQLSRELHRHQGDEGHDVHWLYQAARNNYTDHIHTTKCDHWNT